MNNTPHFLAAMSTPLTDTDVEVHVSAPDPDTGEQFLMRVYRDGAVTTRTIAWRAHVGATWGPEHLLLAERVTL